MKNEQWPDPPPPSTHTHNVIYTTRVLMWDEAVFLQMIRESRNSFKLKFTIKSRQSSEKQTNNNIVTGGKRKKKDLRCTFPWVTAFQSQEETVQRRNRISVTLPKPPLDEPGVCGIREAVCWTVMRSWCMSGKRGSVALEQREQVIVTVVGKVGRTQVGQQLIWVRQLWEKLENKKGSLGLRIGLWKYQGLKTLTL